MKYNITFTLGDNTNEGHGISYTYHITSNYSAKTISGAYQEFVKEIDYDFLQDINDYLSDALSEEVTAKLVNLGILQIDESNTYYLESGEYCIDNGEELLDIFFNIIKFKLPYSWWEYRNLEEETLNELDGAGYGLFDN